MIGPVPAVLPQIDGTQHQLAVPDAAEADSDGDADGDGVVSVARTYNETPDGTYGTVLDAQALDRAVAAGEKSVLIHLAQSATADEGFRTNLDLLNVTGVTIDVETGEVIGSADAQVPKPGLAEHIPAGTPIATAPPLVLSTLFLGERQVEGRYEIVEIYDGAAVGTIHGQKWDDSMPISELAWKANEGIRISRILRFRNLMPGPLERERSLH